MYIMQNRGVLRRGWIGFRSWCGGGELPWWAGVASPGAAAVGHQSAACGCAGPARDATTGFWMRLRASVSVLPIPPNLPLARIEQARDVENESHRSH
jgi:hypothetical protein